MRPDLLAKLHELCPDEAVANQLQQLILDEFQPLEEEVNQAHFLLNQQQALFGVISRLRSPLDLETIFQATAIEVRQLLGADRVGMFRFAPKSNWNDGEFVSEDVDPAFDSAMAHKIHDHCFGEQFAVHYQMGRAQVVADIQNAGLSDCHVKILAQFQVKANLAVPLLQGEDLWGLLCIHQCSASRQWQATDIEFVTHIANHLGVALQHAELLAKLQAEIVERQQAEQRAQELNKGLQQAIVELRAVNKELETFSYSVSHDLRAPLRSIDGFSQALIEDCLDQLDENGHDYLRRIRTATQRMGQLIDDLLTLSRVIRSDMHREAVDLSKVASRVCLNLQQAHPDRQIDINIQPGVIAQGDLRLLQVVLENLLNNAWKFTAKRSQARIEFGMMPLEGDSENPAYFVRDDGVGFDMSYMEKLFSPFQRLHSVIDFPGNGIGLATVQRVVHRHGGQLWAESSLDHGATFYFSLTTSEVKND